jgi:hypothetical protein
VCLIFSVLSTIDEYSDFANETLFWMVSKAFKILTTIVSTDDLISIPIVL